MELWLVPNRARPPEPTPTVTVVDDLGDNLLFDEFGVGCEHFSCSYEDEAAHLDGFAAALKKEPNSWGCVIAYAQSGDDRTGEDWDAPGTALKLARSQKSYLIKRYGFAASRITAVDGGYSWRGVTLWIMRPRARFDRGPFIYPSRLTANRNDILTITEPKTFDLCCKACIRGGTDPYILRNRGGVKRNRR